MDYHYPESMTVLSAFLLGERVLFFALLRSAKFLFFRATKKIFD